MYKSNKVGFRDPSSVILQVISFLALDDGHDLGPVVLKVFPLKLDGLICVQHSNPRVFVNLLTNIALRNL